MKKEYMEIVKLPQKVPILDIYTAAYLLLQGVKPELILKGTRVIFQFEATATVFSLTGEFNDNPTVPVLDYVNTVRQLKAKMFAMKVQR